MVMRVQHVEGEYRVVLPPEAVEAMHLRDGSTVRVIPLESHAAPERRYITREEAIESYLRTEPQHLETYRELAK